VNFSDPKKNIAQFGLQLGEVVADFGVGSGAYVLSALEYIGTSGKIYAIDVQRNLLSKVKNMAREKGLSNVEVLWGDIDELHGTKLSDESVSSVIMSNILFQLENKKGAVNEAFRVLKKDGKVLLVDWSKSYEGLGPHKDAIVSSVDARTMFEKAGFVYVEDINTGDYHYGMIFKK